MAPIVGGRVHVLRFFLILRYHAPGQTLTIQTGGRSWLLRNVRSTYPKALTEYYGDPRAPGAARRQREALVKVLDKGWRAYSEKEGGHACPFDLKLAILGPFGDAAAISLHKYANNYFSFQNEPNMVLDFQNDIVL